MIANWITSHYIQNICTYQPLPIEYYAINLSNCVQLCVLVQRLRGATKIKLLNKKHEILYLKKKTSTEYHSRSHMKLFEHIFFYFKILINNDWHDHAWLPDIPCFFKIIFGKIEFIRISRFNFGSMSFFRRFLFFV